MITIDCFVTGSANRIALEERVVTLFKHLRGRLFKHRRVCQTPAGLVVGYNPAGFLKPAGV
jgi:hypothetical protein